MNTCGNDYPGRPYTNLCVTDRKQVVKGEQNHKLAEVTVASRQPAEGRPELDGQVVTRQKQGEGNYDNTDSPQSPQQTLGHSSLS